MVTKGTGTAVQVVDVRLLTFPELGWAVFAKGVGEAAGIEHGCVVLTRQSFF